MKLVTGQEMRLMDKTVIERFGVPGIVLMENAASQVADEIARRYGSLTGQRVSVVCGKGNNGGDGIAVARHLHSRYHADVTIWLVEPMDKASPDTAINLMIARNFGIVIESIADPDWLLAHLRASHIVVDAVLGTGLVGNPRPASAVAIDAINESGRPVVSIDVPSGLTDTGIPTDRAVQAALTVTLALPKLGLFLYPGVTLSGEIITVDISFPAEVLAAQDISTIALERRDIARWLPERKPGRDSNKGKFGSVVLFAGSPGFLGAASLASEAAARTGAGLVTLGVPDSIFEAMTMRVVDSVMTHSFESSSAGSFSPSSVDKVLSFIEKRDAVGFGCGAGFDDSIREFARSFIARCSKPLVVDADALTILSMEPDRGASLIKGRNAPTVLTPHPGEMGRLLGISTADVQADRLTAVRQAASDFGAVVLLKGQATLIASADGRLAVNTTGNPGMATGGSGDVLTGVITTLLSQIDDPWVATSAAVFLHGLAGDIAADEIGTAGLLASDIVTRIPSAIKACYV